jgi:hypothetical protein
MGALTALCLKSLCEHGEADRVTCCAAGSPEAAEAGAPPRKGGQALRRELMRPQAQTTDDINKQAMAIGGRLAMRAAAGQQVRQVLRFSRA